MSVVRRRITVVAHELRGFVPAGGMGTATSFLALALARMHHEVEILIGINAPDEMDPHWTRTYSRAGIRIRAAPPPDERVEPWHFMHARSMELGLRQDPPDVVVAPDFGAPVYTALRLRQAGLAFEDTLFVVFCHGPWRYALDLSPNLAPPDLRDVLAFGTHEQASVELADVVVSPSAYLLDWMGGRGWRLPQRTLVIPYFTRSVALGEPVASVARGNGGDELRRIAFFGRLDERKGLLPFAAALNALEPQLLRGLELEFIGKATASWPRDRVESLLEEPTKRSLRSVTFETELDQPEALARLGRAGTIAVMPSLQENSPNAVYECLELGIPFIASDVGGVPELIAANDRARVLFEPTPEGVEAALRAVLAPGHVPRPVRRGFQTAESFDRWADVIELRPRPWPYGRAGAIDVVVVHRRSPEALSRCLTALQHQGDAGVRVIVVAAGRSAPDDVWADLVVESGRSSIDDARAAGLRAGSAPYVLFLDEDDVAEPELLATLARAQSASGADVVTCGLRIVAEDGQPELHFFTGQPGGLGVLGNAYGTIALFRRSIIEAPTATVPDARDTDWPLLARLSVSGARLVSIPVPLVTRRVAPSGIEHDPWDALLVAQCAEEALPAPLRSTARLAAGMEANLRNQPSAASFVRGALHRLFRGAR